MRNDDSRHAVLIVEVIIELLQVGLSIALLLDLLGVIIKIERVGASLQLLEEGIPVWIESYLNSLGRCLGSGPFEVEVAPIVGLAPIEGLPVLVPGLVGFLLI